MTIVQLCECTKKTMDLIYHVTQNSYHPVCDIPAKDALSASNHEETHQITQIEDIL